MDIDSAVRRALLAELGAGRYELWFGNGVRFELTGAIREAASDPASGAVSDERLLVIAPTPFLQEWLRRNFRAAIEGAARSVLGRTVPIEIELAAPGECIGTPEFVPTPSKQAELRESAAGSAADSAAAGVSYGGVVAADPPPELAAKPIGVTIPTKVLARRKFARLDSFVVGESNKLAWSSARRAAENPGSLSPLLFCGGTGVGKTHLLEAVWSGLKSRPDRLRVIYLTAEQFTSYFVEALHKSGLPNFRRKYRDVDALLIDDLQFFCGKRATLVELLYTVNTLLDGGRQLVFTADRSPGELGELGRDLVNRLQGGMVCRIESPDYEVRIGIVRQLAAAAGLHLSAEIAAFVAHQITSDARGLSGAINRLSATQLALGEPMTLAVAQGALGELIRDSAPCVKLRDIEAAICDVFGLEPASLQSSRRTKNVAHPRMLAMFLARKHTRAALSEIGSYFGGRSHSTVHSAHQQVGEWMGKQATLSIADAQCSIDEAIRRVEKRLLG